jgi:hypothetical protein
MLKEVHTERSGTKLEGKYFMQDGWLHDLGNTITKYCPTAWVYWHSAHTRCVAQNNVAIAPYNLTHVSGDDKCKCPVLHPYIKSMCAQAQCFQLW